MDLCLPTPENISWYSVSRPLWDLRERHYFGLPVFFSSWVALVRCSRPSSLQVEIWWFPWQPEKWLLIYFQCWCLLFRHQKIRQGVRVLFVQMRTARRCRAHCYLLLEWALKFLQLLLIDDGGCGTWIGFHTSYFPIDSNFNSGTVAWVRFMYSDLKGEIRIRWFLLFLFLNTICGWLC